VCEREREPFVNVKFRHETGHGAVHRY